MEVINAWAALVLHRLRHARAAGKLRDRIDSNLQMLRTLGAGDSAGEPWRRGFALAFGLIFVVMLLLFRNLRMTLLAVVLNIFPVLVIGGVMAATGIDQDARFPIDPDDIAR